MKQIKLIIAADEPALFYASIASAERDLEPVDVKNGVFTSAFGPLGEPYQITTDQARVCISPIVGAKPDPEALRKVLQGFLKGVDTEVRSGENLEHLLQKCLAYLDG